MPAKTKRKGWKKANRRKPLAMTDYEFACHVTNNLNSMGLNLPMPKYRGGWRKLFGKDLGETTGARMKRCELKVGMKIKHEGGTEFEVTAIGKNNFLVSENEREGMACVGSLDEYSIVEPELFYIWRIKYESSCWFKASDYMNKHGENTLGNEHVIWPDIEKHICTEFKPILKDGSYFEKD